MRRLFYLLVVLVATACSYSGSHPGRGFDEAEALLHTDPTAALEKLNSCDLSTFDDSATLARWALLYTEAMVVNNLAAPTDTIVNIAVDFYGRHGYKDEFAKASRLKALMMSADKSDKLATALYLQKEKEFMLYKERSRRAVYAGVIAAILIIAAGVILWQRQRIKIKQLENNALMSEASALRDDRSVLESRLNSTLANRFGLIDDLCQTYYESQGTKSEKKALVEKVKSQIEAMKTDESVFADMESSVNTCKDNMLVLLKEEWPDIKAGEYSLAVYLASGLSNRAIALLLGESIDVVYKRKSRLKARISASGMPHQALFMSIF